MLCAAKWKYYYELFGSIVFHTTLHLDLQFVVDTSHKVIQHRLINYIFVRLQRTVVGCIKPILPKQMHVFKMHLGI